MLLLLAGAALTIPLAPLFQRVLGLLGAEDVPFAVVVFRTLQMVLLVLSALMLARSGGSGARAWGLAVNGRPWRRAGGAFLVGAASIAMVVLTLWLLDLRTTRYDLETGASHWVSVVAVSLLSATVIGVVEELWFRGGLYTLLQRAGGVRAAVLLTSVVYAVSHFFDRDMPVQGDAAHWREAAGIVLQGGQAILSSGEHGTMLALAAGGAWLAALRYRHGDIIGAIALHTGWVLVIKVFKKATYIEPDAPWRALAGGYDDVVGWLAFAVLLVFALAAWRGALHERGRQQ
jgi:membrane protease YdiL (CAAX protease family)